MQPEKLYRRYQELQAYVGWTEADGRRVQAAGSVLAPRFSLLIDDFYAEIARHPQALKVITGGQEQIERLKGTLRDWLGELLSGSYDAPYVARRWRVGRRHVAIGLDQVYTNVALSRLRTGLVKGLQEAWQDDGAKLRDTVRSLNKLLDLDLAIIEDAYQAAHVALVKERSEATFLSLVDAAPCVILILRPDYAVAYFSPFAEALTGYRADEVLGQDFRRYFLPENGRQAATSEVQHVFAGVPSRGYEGQIRCRDGTLRWMVWNAQALVDYEGQPGVLAVGQDITMLKIAQEQVVQSERLAAIGQMVAALAHESGNALARSQTCLEMLALEVEERPDALDLIVRIQQAQDHLRQLYEEVRGYASPIKLEREDWDLAGIWRQAWQNLALKRQGRQVEVTERLEADPRCHVDHFRLEQVFRNIFDNSLAACKDPVGIDIHCSEIRRADQSLLRIAIRDNGPGLTAEQRQRIFEPFFTTKTKGTGLGMAIAKRIVEAHQGTISVTAAEKGGAEVVITLPRSLSSSV